MPSSGKGQETSFRVRETPDWKKHAADLEAEMIKRRSVMAGTQMRFLPTLSEPVH
jgi:hypothetical protein